MLLIWNQLAQNSPLVMCIALKPSGLLNSLLILSWLLVLGWHFTNLPWLDYLFVGGWHPSRYFKSQTRGWNWIFWYRPKLGSWRKQCKFIPYHKQDNLLHFSLCDFSLNCCVLTLYVLLPYQLHINVSRMVHGFFELIKAINCPLFCCLILIKM